MVYFTSDTHFNHKNIIKYCDRPFENVGDMNEQLIAKWNEVVQDGDVVYHLGDFALGRQEYDIDKIVKRLNGEIRLIRGNHDRWSVGFYIIGKFFVFNYTAYIILRHNKTLEFCSSYVN